MYRVIIDTKYGNHIEFEVEDINDERVQEILMQEYITACDIRKVNEINESKRLKFAPVKESELN